MNPIFKTGVDTLGTTAIISPVVYDTTFQNATDQIISTGDFKAPLIALVSSITIQFVLKGLKLLFSKIFPSNV